MLRRDQTRLQHALAAGVLTFPDPPNLPLFRPNKDDQVVGRGIIGVEQIGHDPQQAEAASEDDELVLIA